MTATNEWTPLSTRFFRHPKVVEAGRDGALLFLASLAYCQEHLTDGHVPAGVLRVLCAESWSTPKAAEALVASGLWLEVDGGWLVDGWLDWNRSRAEVEANREAERARKAEWRRKKSQGRDTGRDTGRDGDATPESRSTPSPSPTPIEKDSLSLLDRAARTPGESFLDDFYPERVG